MKFRSRPLFAMLALVCGCEDAPIIQAPPAPPPSASSAATVPVPKLSATPSASGSAAASVRTPISVMSIDAPTGPLRWADFAGPFPVVEYGAGEVVWGVTPVSAGWSNLRLTVGQAVRLDEKDVVFRASEAQQEVYVPAALTAPASKPQALAKGEAVVVPVKTSRAFGKIVGVADDKVKVRFRFAGETQEQEFSSAIVIKLDGSMTFGQPVGFQETVASAEDPSPEFSPGQLINSSDAKAWILESSGRPRRVGLEQVRPLSVHVAHKEGAQVFASIGNTFSPGTVVAIEDEGLRYSVMFKDQDRPTSVPFEMVSVPIR